MGADTRSQTPKTVPGATSRYLQAAREAGGSGQPRGGLQGSREDRRVENSEEKGGCTDGENSD